MAKKKKSKKALRLLLTTLSVIFLGSFCYVYINQEIVLNKQEKQIERMQTENAKLEEAYQQMLKQVEDKNTLEYIDKYMRSHFGMVQEGETRIDIEIEGNNG